MFREDVVEKYETFYDHHFHKSFGFRWYLTRQDCYVQSGFLVCHMDHEHTIYSQCRHTHTRARASTGTCMIREEVPENV
jgi:hypothetical protein